MLKKRWLFEMERPNPHQTWQEFFRELRRDMAQCGRYFALTCPATSYAGHVFPRELRRIDPMFVTCFGERYAVTGPEPLGALVGEVYYAARFVIDSKYPHREVAW